MLHHVAMEEPQPGIVGDKDEIRLFAGRHQVGVAKNLPRFIAKFPRIDPEMMTVKMHSMFPSRVVPHAKHGDLAELEAVREGAVRTARGAGDAEVEVQDEE